MTRVVLDTNVIISAALNTRAGGVSFSAPSLCLELALLKKITLVVCAELLAEYEEVLLRPKFGFAPRLARALLADIRRVAIVRTSVNIPVRIVRDPDDADILGCAVAGHADFLVTGNIRHFPAQHKGVSAVAPATFVFWAISGGLLS